MSDSFDQEDRDERGEGCEDGDFPFEWNVSEEREEVGWRIGGCGSWWTVS